MAGRGPLDGMLEQLLAPRYFANGQPSSYRLAWWKPALAHGTGGA